MTMVPVTDFKGDVGSGWHGLLDDMHAELAAACPDYETYQVKEKFGTLTTYINGNRAAMDITMRYRQLSQRICELCGQPGTCGSSSAFWVKTLCPACREKWAGGWRPWHDE
jgi:hypothetical protein